MAVKKRQGSPLGIHSRKKPVIKHKSNEYKTIFKKIIAYCHNNKEKLISYLKSDSYMFHPLLPSHPFLDISSHEPPFEMRMEAEEIIEEEKSETLLKKVGDYMKSDTFMYAPLVVPPPSHTRTGCPLHRGLVEESDEETTPVKKVIEKTKRPKRQTRKAMISKDENTDDQPLGRITALKYTGAYRETVKQVVHQNCRLSSASGKVLVENERRKASGLS